MKTKYILQNIKNGVSPVWSSRERGSVLWHCGLVIGIKAWFISIAIITLILIIIETSWV